MIHINKFQKSISVCAVALMFYALHHFYGVEAFLFDSSVYWEFSSAELIFNQPTNFRGYLYSTLLSPIRLLSDLLSSNPMLPFRIATSVIYAAACTLLLPSVYVGIFGGTVNLVRRLVPALLLVFFIPGVILHPLSDLPAFLLLTSSIFFVQRAASAKHTRRLLMLVLAGVCIGGAYNIRTIYLFPLIVAVPFIAFSAIKTDAFLRRIMYLTALVIGIFLISLPQMFINERLDGRFSPLVTAQVGQNSLFASQLMWGLTLQRYETSTHPSVPAGSVFYIDDAGKQLLSEVDIKDGHFSLENYVSLAIRHPADFLGLYARHVFNGLDLRDGEVYIKYRTGIRRDIIAFLNFIALFIGALTLCAKWRPEAIRRDSQLTALAGSSNTLSYRCRAVWFLILFLPTLAIIPGAVETRFFLPAYLLLYCTLAFHTYSNTLWRFTRTRLWPVVLALIVSFSVFSAITSSTQANVQYTYP